jgi:VCBS repeat-containing protein
LVSQHRLLNITIGAGLLLGLLAAVPGRAQDPESYHYLEELKLRVGSKPYERMLDEGLFPSERTVYFDSITGVETWKVSHDPAIVRHKYYDVPVWNPDGTYMMLRHESEVAESTNWLVPADSSFMLPLPESPIVDLKWSWLDPDVIYGFDGGVFRRVEWPTWTVTDLFDLNTVVPPVDTAKLDLVPPHPVDDRLLLHTYEQGRFFSFDQGLSQLTEIPTDGRWATPDGIHRVRWTKDDEFNVFFGQNNVVVGGTSIFERRQYIVSLGGQLEECMLPGVEDRTKHPDITVDGLAVAGFIEQDFWVYYCNGEFPSVRLYEAEDTHHGSVLFDGRWYVIDNEDGLTYEVAGLNVSDSNVLMSLDGRAQFVLNYHYSLQGDLLNYTEPRTASSPDGTKVAYSSNMMSRGVPGNEGTSEMYVTVVRRPFPPRNFNATAGNGDIRLSWDRPLHSPTEIHWNPGNLSMEVWGYHVWRAEESGGPYEQINSALVTDTQFVDSTAVADQTYYYLVQSVEPSGLASVFSEEDAASTSFSGWQGSVRHHYEAELATVDLPLVPQLEPGGASGEWFIGTFALEPDPANPLESLPSAVSFDVRAPVGGTYYLWGRVRGYEGSVGTLEVDLNGVPKGELTVDQDAWVWVPLASSLSMSTGYHTISMATDELSLGLDTIAITDDPSYVPTGFAGIDTTPPAPPTNTRLVAVDGTTKKLLWDAPPDPDVQYYNVYCGRDSSYPLANPNRLYSPTDTLVWDWGIPPGTTTVYKVTAVDRFGNESAPAVHDPAVSGEGSAPEALDDAYSVDEDFVLAPGGLGVIDNDHDGDGDVLSAILTQEPANGDLVLNPDGTFTYTPDAEWSGVDTFVYKADDSLVESLEATVTITVNPVNDAPVAAVDSYSLDEDDHLNQAPLTGLLSNDTDVEDDPLTAQLVVDAANGELTLDPDGSFIYLPDDHFNGVDTFTYRAWDGTDLSATTLVTITVYPIDDEPQPVVDSYSATEDVALEIDAPGVLDNDLEFDGEQLTAILHSEPDNGTLTLQGDGRFLYTPFDNFNGTDRFYYRITDGITESSEVVVTITVDAVNDPPIALPDSYSTDEDKVMRISAGVLGNDADVDNANLDAVVVTDPAHGWLVMDEKTGDFIFYPDRGWNGVDSFTYRAVDGIDESNSATVTLTVNPVNDTVKLRDSKYTIDEDEVLTIPVPGLLSRLREPDGEALTAVLVQDVAKGTLDLRPDGSFTYTPEPNDSGAVVFSFQADDGVAPSATARVDITIVEVPDAPDGVEDSYQAVAGSELVVPVASGVLQNDSDGDGDPLTSELVSSPSHGTLTEFKPGGRFDYMPDNGFVGVDTFTYRATDGVLDSGPVTVTITVAPSEQGSIEILHRRRPRRSK